MYGFFSVAIQFEELWRKRQTNAIADATEYDRATAAAGRATVVEGRAMAAVNRVNAAATLARELVSHIEGDRAMAEAVSIADGFPPLCGFGEHYSPSYTPDADAAADGSTAWLSPEESQPS